MRLSVVIAATSLAAGGISVADNVQAAVKERTNIPAQELAPALHMLAKTRDFQLVYVSEDVSDLSTSGAVGEFTPEEALRKLLSGTGLSFQYLDAKTVTILQANRPVTEDAGTGGSSIVRLAGASASAGDFDDRTDDRGGDEDQDLPDLQEGSSVGDKEKARRSKIEEIVITGSRIRGAQNASPVFTVTRQQIDQAGFATVEELVSKLPQNFGAGASLNSRSDSAINRRNVVGGVVDDLAGGTSVNLRGLGASSTLTLLNGRRMSPSGRSARFTNISSIPVSAIERVEVLTDGASAIYGSDAIGGVVNFILRDDYEGAETRLRYGSDGRGDTSSVLFGQSVGNSWNSGNVLLSYEYFYHDDLANSDRDITSSNDLRRFGGTDWRSTGGNPANIRIGTFPFQFFAIPSGQDGTSLTATDFDPNVSLHFHNARAGLDFLPVQERHSAFLHSSQNVGKAELFAEAQFSSWERESLASFGSVDINVPDTNPFFVDPTGTGLTTVRVDNYSLNRDLGPRESFGEVESFGAALGLRFDIAGSWNAEVVSNWSKEEATSGDKQRLNGDALTDSVNQTDRNLAFNPFGDGSNTNPAVLESLVDQSRRVENESDNELWSFSLVIDGKAFELPGGPVQVATGVEFREESLFSISEPAEGGVASDSSRRVSAVYAEVFFPLVSSENSRPGLRQLELSLAGRYENYSDFGSSTNPKLGLVWSPIQALTLRGTYGTSFRAPALFDLDISGAAASSSSSYLPTDPFVPDTIPFPIILRLGGNEDLQAETATTWSAGFQWRPESVRGLSVDTTYFNVDFEDRIDTSGANIITGTIDPRFATLLTLNPTPEHIAALVNDPRWVEDPFDVFTPAADVLSGAEPVGGILDLRKRNLSQTIVTGVDLQLSQNFETALGSFVVGLNGNYLFDFKRRLLVVDPLVDEVDTLGRPVDFRARANVTWMSREWSASGFVNYTEGYTDNVSDPERAINSWTTVDLSLSYDTGDTSEHWFFNNTRLSLTIQNAFDEDPPFVNTLGGLGYDSANATALGRFLALQVTKDW